MNQWLSHLSWTAPVWIGAALLLALLEVLLGSSFFLLCLGAVCFMVGSIVYCVPHLSAEMQLLIFSTGSLLSIAVWRHYLRKKKGEFSHSHSTLNRRAEQYIGRRFMLSEPIINGRGKIRVDDSAWPVEGPELPKGAQVEITGVDGVILKAKAIE